MKHVLFLYVAVLSMIACAILAETAFQTGEGKLYFFAAACMVISLICALACRRSKDGEA